MLRLVRFPVRDASWWFFQGRISGHRRQKPHQASGRHELQKFVTDILK
jgi:hypothetical protein